MVRTLARRSAAGALAGLVAAAGLAMPAQATQAVPTDQAGTIVGWGATEASAAFTLPQDLQGTKFSAASAGSNVSAALTLAGKVVVLGESGVPGANLQNIPTAVQDATVTAISAGPNNIAAVTSAGTVVAWGLNSVVGSPNAVPEGLTGVKDVAVGAQYALALKTDGTVVGWGRNNRGQTTIPDGLTGVASLSAGTNVVYALKTDGTVVAWGQDAEGSLDLPAALSVPGNVKQVVTASRGGLALLADGSLTAWGSLTGAGENNSIPSALTGKTVTHIASFNNQFTAIDSTGQLTTWGDAYGSNQPPAEIATLPANLVTSDIASLSFGGSHALALVTQAPSEDVVATAKPTITGTAAVGQTLTGTPATFSGSPDSVTNQWLAGGVAIAGQTGSTLTITAAQAGKAITFSSTATKGSATPVVSTSDPTATVPGGAPTTSASTVTISAGASAYGRATTATVTVGNSAGKPVAGTVTLSGAGVPQSATLAGGSATFNLGNALAPGSYTLTATYSGSADLNPSSSAGVLSIGKGATKRPTFKANKASTSKKKGKATVTVARSSGPANASGKVTVTLKNGKTTKKISATLKSGKRSITLPKLKKGTWKVQITYGGDKNYAPQKSSTFKLKIKK